jgi:hypothetical protein
VRSDGDVLRGLAVPIFMVFPRLFTAPTLATRTFKIEFEVCAQLSFGRAKTDRQYR